MGNPVDNTIIQIAIESHQAQQAVNDLSATITALRANIGITDAALKQLEGTMGRMAGAPPAAAASVEPIRNLGNEFQRTSGLAGMFERQLFHMATGLVLWTTFREITQVINEQVTALRDYSLETARFAAITEQSLSTATAEWDKYAAAAASAGVKPMEAATPIRIAQIQGGSDEEKLQFVRTVAQLVELTGEKANTVSESLSSILRQAGLGLGDVKHIGDMVIDTLSRVPAASIRDVFSALQEAPAVAEMWGVSFEKAYSIIMAGSARIQESPEQVSTAFQRLSKGINEMGNDSTKLWTAQEHVMKQYGISLVDTNGKLRPILDILKDVATKLPSLSPAGQQDLLQTIAGGSLRPEQMRNLVGAIAVFGGAVDDLTQIGGGLDKATAIIDKSFGQMMNVLDANIELLKEKGDILQNVIVSIARGTIGQFGGKQGIQATENIEGMVAGNVMAGTQKQGFMDDIIRRSGGDVETARRLAREHNDKVNKAVDEEIFKLPVLQRLNPVTSSAIELYRQGLTVSDEDITAAVEQAKKAHMGENTPIEMARRNATSAGGMTAPVTPMSDLAYSVLQNGLPTNAMDATKSSNEQIAQAKQRSVELSNQELTAMRAELVLLGLTKDQIDTMVAAREKELDTTVKLLQTQNGLQYATGKEAAYLQETLKSSQAKSNFQFERLRNMSAAQFAEVAQQAQGYNNLLSRLGSPEETSRITVMLDNGVLKTLNVRMSALQMAIEDQTKVAKAQLSGTWNLPSGATALVPISSLDLQRWHGQGEGGGGFDASSLAALTRLAGTTAGGQMNVSDSATHQLLMARGQEQAANYKMTNWLQRYSPMPDVPTPLQRQMPWYEKYAPTSAPNVAVQITSLPQKITLTNNTTVVMNGAVLARGVSQNMYDLLTKFFRAGGTQPRGVLR